MLNDSPNRINNIITAKSTKLIQDILEGKTVADPETPVQPLPKTHNEINTAVGETYRQILYPLNAQLNEFNEKENYSPSEIRRAEEAIDDRESRLRDKGQDIQDDPDLERMRANLQKMKSKNATLKKERDTFDAGEEKRGVFSKIADRVLPQRVTARQNAARTQVAAAERAGRDNAYAKEIKAAESARNARDRAWAEAEKEGNEESERRQDEWDFKAELSRQMRGDNRTVNMRDPTSEWSTDFEDTENGKHNQATEEDMLARKEEIMRELRARRQARNR